MRDGAKNYYAQSNFGRKYIVCGCAENGVKRNVATYTN